MQILTVFLAWKKSCQLLDMELILGELKCHSSSKVETAIEKFRRCKSGSNVTDSEIRGRVQFFCLYMKFALFTNSYCGNAMKQVEMRRECSTHGSDGHCVHFVQAENLEARGDREDSGRSRPLSIFVCVQRTPSRSSPILFFTSKQFKKIWFLSKLRALGCKRPDKVSG